MIFSTLFVIFQTRIVIIIVTSACAAEEIPLITIDTILAETATILQPPVCCDWFFFRFSEHRPDLEVICIRTKKRGQGVLLPGPGQNGPILQFLAFTCQGWSAPSAGSLNRFFYPRLHKPEPLVQSVVVCWPPTAE